MSRQAFTRMQDGHVEEGIDTLLDSGYRYAFSLAHDAAEAEDLLQDACVAILEAGAPWDRPYLFATIRNRFIDRYRRNRRILFLSLEAEGDAYDENGEEAWPSADIFLNEQLGQALGSLRAEEREALFLTFVEGFTAEEIGRLTSRPRGTILSLLHRAKAKLREQLEQQRAL